MFASSFDYYRATSVAEAGDLLRKNPGAKLLAGGHSLIPLLKLRLAAPAALIDIGRIKALRGIKVSGKKIRIGALTTHADPASDLPTVLLALDAIFTVIGPRKERTIKAADFFEGMMATALQDREILTAIDVPAKAAGTGMSYAKFSHPASR